MVYHTWRIDLASQTAKLFMNGRSQGVRLPAAFRFDTDEVFIRKDTETGDVILSRKPATWDDVFELLKGVEIPDDFLSPEDRDKTRTDRDPFEGWEERAFTFSTRTRSRTS